MFQSNSRTAGMRPRQSEVPQALSSAAVKALGTSDGQMVFGYSREDSKLSMWGLRTPPTPLWSSCSSTMDTGSECHRLLRENCVVSKLLVAESGRCQLSSQQQTQEFALKQRATGEQPGMVWEMARSTEMKSKSPSDRGRACCIVGTPRIFKRKTFPSLGANTNSKIRVGPGARMSVHGPSHFPINLARDSARLYGQPHSSPSHWLSLLLTSSSLPFVQ